MSELHMFDTRAVVLSTVLALSACGGAAQRTGSVSIVSASRQLVGDGVQLDLDIANGTDAPAYVYDSERRVSFDEGAQQTTIALQRNHGPKRPPHGPSAPPSRADPR